MIASPPQLRWSTPSTPLDLPVGTVDVWLAELDGDPYEAEQLARYLAPDEHERASRIRMLRDRQRWVVARGTLRMLLARYLDTNPRLVELASAPQGKPFLLSPQAYDLRFNLSHSADLALYAFTRGRDVGVDLEYCRPDMDEMPVAERLFTLEETAFISTHSGSDRQRAFLRCWTAKEAYLKARGLGLTTAARNQVRVVSPGGASAPRDWTVVSLDPTSETVAMLAVHGPVSELNTWFWESPHRP